MCVFRCVCVCVAGGGERERTHPAGPFLSLKAHLHFQLSDLLVSLSDIQAVNLSAGLPFMTCAMIMVLPFHPTAGGGCSSLCNSPSSSVLSAESALALQHSPVFPAAQESRAKETLTDVFFLSPGDDEEPLTRSTPAPASPDTSLLPPFASADRHQGGCWDTLQ